MNTSLKWFTLAIFTIIILSFFLTSCAPPAIVPSAMPESISINGDSSLKVFRTDNFGIYRFVDNEAGVVCYMVNNGISCLPVSQANRTWSH